MRVIWFTVISIRLSVLILRNFHPIYCIQLIVNCREIRTEIVVHRLIQAPALIKVFVQTTKDCPFHSYGT